MNDTYLSKGTTIELERIAGEFSAGVGPEASLDQIKVCLESKGFSADHLVYDDGSLLLLCGPPESNAHSLRDGLDRKSVRYITPVYRHNGSKLLLTDTLKVEFSRDLTDTELERFCEKYGIVHMGKLPLNYRLFRVDNADGRGPLMVSDLIETQRGLARHSMPVFLEFNTEPAVPIEDIVDDVPNP